MKKAISVNIMKHNGSDCSNGGISSRYNDILLECEDGCIQIDENNLPENLCKVVKRHLFGQDYYHIEPVACPTGIGWMSGGCIVYSCDNRFSVLGNGYPLVLHDRQESQKENNMYSAD